MNKKTLHTVAIVVSAACSALASALGALNPVEAPFVGLAINGAVALQDLV